MPAVDTAPLMNSPLWKTWDPATRKQALALWQDAGTSADDRAQMLQMMQQAPAAAAPPPTTGPVFPLSPWEALKSAWRGEQRMPWQAAPPETGIDPSTLVKPALERLPGGKAVSGLLEGMTSPSSVGELVGTTLVPGPLKPVAGALGAGGGEAVRQYQAGEPLDWRKIAKESAWSLGGEALESAGRGILRQVGRESPGGIIMRRAQAAEEAREVPGRVFQPRPADQISEAFEQVRRSNLPIDTEDMTRHLTTMSPGHQADALNIFTQLDRQHRTGRRYEQLYKDLLSGKGMAGSSIGDLQSLRSHLRTYAASMDPGEGRNFVRNLQGAVDDTIDYGMTTMARSAEAAPVRDMLHTARRDWAHRMAADDLGDLIENKITSTENLENVGLNLRGLYDDLRRGRSEASRSINRSLDLTPGARERFEQEMRDISRLYNRIGISMTDVQGIYRMPGIAGVRQAIGQLLLTDTGRRMFQQAIIEGRGRLSPNALATLLGAARREYAPELTGRTSMEQEGASRRAPGGIARSTD